MPDPAPPTAAEPATPRLPAALRASLDDDLDPLFPDLDGLDLDAGSVSFPEARTFTVLRSRLSGCDLDVGDSTVDAQDAHLVDLDLSGRCIEGFTRVHLERCRLTGADFGEARLRDVRFTDCALDLTSFRSTTIERTVVAGGRVDEADLSAARCSDVVLSGVDVAGLRLHGARFERVDVTDADIDAVADLRELRGCILSPTQAVALAPRLARVAGMSVATPLSHRS